MRLLYWTNYWLGVVTVRVGDWALQKSHRPLIVLGVTSLAILGFTALVLHAAEELFRRP